MTDTAVCEVLEWDSRHFGLKIGRVARAELSERDLASLQACRQEGAFDVLYLLTSIDQLDTMRLAERVGFQFTDIRITFGRSAVASGPGQPAEGIRPFSIADLPHLKRLARELHHDSRFHVDPHFPRAESCELFAIWIERACADPNHAVFVADVDGRPAGYIACERVTDAIGRIQLVGVDVAARGAGLGTRLVHTALGWFAAQHITDVSVVTQGRNVGAHRLYQRCGFLTASIAVWYHWWRKP